MFGEFFQFHNFFKIVSQMQMQMLNFCNSRGKNFCHSRRVFLKVTLDNVLYL